MKKSRRFNFIIGFVIGAVMFSGGTAVLAASGILAQPKTAIIVVDGKEVDLKGYLIEGSHYFQLRDLAEKLKPGGKDFSVVWDGANNRVLIDTSRGYDPNETLAAPAVPSTNIEIARTKAWDDIKNTLGGVPECVRKIEYQGSIFYLAPSVSDNDFIAVLAAGPEAVKLKPPLAANTDKLYMYPVYILWNSEKTVLLVHPITPDSDNILEPVAIPAALPAKLAQAADGTPGTVSTAKEAVEYMLTAEYANAVRTEFYRLLNEYRAANGLKKLEVNLELQKYADIRADEQRTRFGHTRPDGSPAGSGWYNSQNNLNSRYAENVTACGAINADPKDTAKGIFSIWKNSAGHNRHMLYNFDSRITMAFGITPKLDADGFVTSGAVFATGY